jgi:cytochrome P450
MDDRRKGLRKGNFGDDGDLLGILLQNELYSGDQEKTIDELIIFFLAGNETVKTSSTNTVCYLAMHDDIKAKFMAEISGVLDQCADNFDELLTQDDVEGFSYVRNCWYESMRL